MDGMKLFRAINISAAGLSVQRMKLDVVAENLANIETTRTSEGGPYRRKNVRVEITREKRSSSSAATSFQRLLADRFGKASSIQTSKPLELPSPVVEQDDNTPFTLEYRPNHPDADPDGMVKMPNINVVDEMVNMITATRAYEANVTAIQSAKEMFMRALEI
jgi:flagellar basal-body rod protein FlgC